MPTYDYKCEKCGKTFEYFQTMSDEPLSVCEECHGHLKRLIGGGLGVIFKGSGFYVTDNKGSKSNSAVQKTTTPLKPDSAPASPESAPAASPQKTNGKKETVPS